MPGKSVIRRVGGLEEQDKVETCPSNVIRRVGGLEDNATI